MEDGIIPLLFQLFRTDCCGEVVALGSVKHRKLLGARVLVRACIKPEGFHSTNSIWMRSDFDGALLNM